MRNRIVNERQTPAGGSFRVGVDAGGTFTDVVAVDQASGELFSTKTPSTPDDPSRAVVAGLYKLMGQVGFGPENVTAVSHGTTVATNALLSERFDDLGLITTRGFRYILEIARQSVPSGYGNSYFWVKPDRIVPLERVREVTERLDFRGEVLRPFDEAEATEVARWFREQGSTSLGVCFIHAYANPAHERRMREVLRREFPEASVSLSSDVLPEYREYERTLTTLVDAFVKPRVSAYVERIRERLAAEVGRVPFYIMKSNGGVISAGEVAGQPIATILSGPAAGALGAAFVASAAGFDRILTLDAGGTSTDVALIEAGAPHLTTEGSVGPYPVKVPMIDVVTVGTGGGSIARVATDGGLEVGPKSAGADPGPLCYDRGGTEATLTDANLVLGRIPASLLGGEVPLNRALAEAGLAGLAKAIGLDPFRTAAGVLEIATWNQANAIRRVSVRRGLDPREYTLVAFGGAGPLLAGQLVDILSLRAALVPPAPGNLSALGLLVVDLRSDYVLTRVQHQAALDLAATNALLATLGQRAREALRRQGCPEDRMRFLRTADLRYFGQAWEVRVDLPDGDLDPAAAEAAVRRFHAAHERIYGYSYREPGGPGASQQAVEWVNVRVTGLGLIDRPAERAAPPGRGAAPVARRPVYFDGTLVDCPVYARAALGAGDAVSGPAIVEEYGSTTVVYPRQRARVDRLGNLILEQA